jgi:hypothetical protein
MPIEERRQLAYDAVTKSLARQDVTLSNLRNRSTILLTAAALITSFGSGVGLLNTDPTHGNVFPHSFAYGLLVILILIGASSVYIVWPVQTFTFGPNAKYFLDRLGTDTDADKVVENMSRCLLADKETNEKAITWRMRAFELGLLLLGVEVIVFVLGAVHH